MKVERTQVTFLPAMILLACLTLTLGSGIARAQDADSDGDPDVTDPCPHVASATPALAAGHKVTLKYDSTGPGSNDDQVVVRKFWITTLASFNPTAGDNVHLTLRNTMTGATLYAVDFNPASWTQPNPLKLTFKYKDNTGAANGARNALLKEPIAITPPGSNLYKFRLSPAKDTNIASALGVGDGVEAIVEVQQGFAGICFSASADTCTISSSKDFCLP